MPNLKIYNRGNQNLAIIPGLPQWFIVNNTGAKVLRMLVEETLTVDQVVSRFFVEDQEDIRKFCGELEPLLQETGNKQISNALTDRTTVAMISVTRRCNLTCPHCYVDANNLHGYELKVEEHKRLATQLYEHLATDPLTQYKVNLTGGEPFACHQILSIIRCYREAGFAVAMSTNGLLIKDRQIQALAEMDITLSVSLDGAYAATHDAVRGSGTFDKVVGVFEKLQIAGVRIGVNHLVHQGNIDELEETINLAYELGCSGFNPINLVQLGRACDSALDRVSEVEIFKRLTRYLEVHPEREFLFRRTSLFSSLGAALLSGITCASCGVGNRPCAYITPEGDVYPCANTQKAEFRLGNIRQESMPDIFSDNHKVTSQLRALQVDALNATCSSCDVRRFCGGDCRGETYNVTGDIRAPYVACQDRHDSIIELMWIVANNPHLFEDRANEFLDNASRGI